MLSDRVQKEVERRQQRAAEAQARREALDLIIQPAFETLHADFVQMLQAVTGMHGTLSLALTPRTIAVTTRTFAALNVEEPELVSTLNTDPESVRFVASLSFVTKEEFGRIQIETTGIGDIEFNRHHPTRAALMNEGILMKGYAAPKLVVLHTNRSTEDLTPAILEDFLAAVVIRGRSA